MNDVFRETKDGIPNLADIAQVLLQALDGFVLLFDAKGKARDSMGADANNLHPVHRRMIDSGLGEGLPENLYKNQIASCKRPRATVFNTQGIQIKIFLKIITLSFKFMCISFRCRHAICRRY